MSRGFGLKPLPGAASQRSQNGLFRGKHDLSLKNIGAPTSQYMPTGTCRFCRSRLASQPDKHLEVRCKLRKVGEYEIERLHRAMLVERDPESLRNLARQLTKALEERIKTLGEQRQPRPNS